MSSPKFLIMFNLLGNLIIMSSSSWMSMWVGMEFTSLTIPPLMVSLDSSIISKINAWKYYMIQCYSSALFLLSIMCMTFSSQHWNSSNIQWVMIFLSMLMKMGIFPFHGWMFQISNSLNWIHFLIISTMQKIGPLIVLSEIYKPLSESMSMDHLLSAIICLMSIPMVMNNSIRYFMIISSIINATWMMSASQVSKYSFIMFILFYFIHLIIIFNFLSKEFSNNLDMTFYNNKKEFYIEVMKVIMMMSMIGMPPLVGFFTKLLVMEHLITQGQIQTGIILTFSSSIIMLMYLSMTFFHIMNMRIDHIQFNSKYLMPMSMMILSSFLFFY